MDSTWHTGSLDRFIIYTSFTVHDRMYEDKIKLMTEQIKAKTTRYPNGEAVMELLRELHRGGATICMVTHDPRYAAHADRGVHLFDGRVVEGGRWVSEKHGFLSLPLMVRPGSRESCTSSAGTVPLPHSTQLAM